MGCGGSVAGAAPEVKSPEEVTDDGTWKLWSALDVAEEMDKTKLVRFFSRLMKQYNDVEDNQKEDVEQILMPLEVKLEAPDTKQGTLVLTQPLAPGSATDLLNFFSNGMSLHMRYAVMICREAITKLRAEPNVLEIAAPTKGSPLVVVGDLHGSLPDLAHILNKVGWPGTRFGMTRRYVFNGDFVDRGPHGCEVLLTLLALKALHPEEVFLIRGNHEDTATSEAYGFKEEVINKFSVSMFNVFGSVFKALPLCGVVGAEQGNGIFVVHAGLFRDQTVALDDINQVNRFAYGTLLNDGAEGYITTQRNDELVEDMTWSDPMDDFGKVQNDDRGAGIFFGPDVIDEFLTKNNLSTIVRSHEVMRDGSHNVVFGDISCWTVFSASNYSGGNNHGAVLEFRDLSKKPKVHKYRSQEPPSIEDVDKLNMDKLGFHIARRHYRLLTAFEDIDHKKSHQVTLNEWEQVMSNVLEMQIQWGSIRETLSGTDIDEDNKINYKKFLKNYILGKINEMDINKAISIDSLYDRFEMLQAVFRAWDVDHNGSVDQDEFARGINVLNELEPDPQQQLDADLIFRMIDIDGSGEIDLNEFCESYRLLQ